jgi:DNA-binding transcriptional LysR family regulator
MRTDDLLASMHDLATLVRVAKAGSSLAAARQHGLPPSAVSRQIARLGNVLNLTLLATPATCN